MFDLRKIRFLFFALIQSFVGLVAAQPIIQFSFEEESGTVFVFDSVGQQQFPVFNHFNRAERIDGVKGKALRLDGYSTWVIMNPFQLNSVEKEFTIEAWYATEAFNFQKSSIVSQQTANAGFSLSIGRFGTVDLDFYADNSQYQISTDQYLEKYTWNHIVATVDLSASVTCIYVNGSLRKTMNLEEHSALKRADNQALFIGRHAIYQSVGGFQVNCLNGALDEVAVYDHAMTETTVLERFQMIEQTIPDLSIDPIIRHNGDNLRPAYHPMPNTGWANESYGLIRYNGKYHMFFQKNPNAPQLFFMHWGHLSSPDLVQWKEERIALSPSPGFDSFGVWSGTTIMNETEEPVIFYTGVDGIKAGIGSATKSDDSLVAWNKSLLNPLIPNPPPSFSHKDFRDPYIWKSGPFYYMIVGSGLHNNGGGILFTYRSSDLVNWENITPLFQSENIQLSGEFWEMPLFFPLDDSTYLLSVTPVPTPTKRAETIYWVGNWKNEIFTPFQSTPKSLELIQENLLSPSIGMDENNRITYMGIIPEDRSTDSQIEAGWRHTFSIPRVIRLLKDRKTLGQIPHPNLCRLRNEQISYEQLEIGQGTEFNLPGFASNQAEFSFNLSAEDKSKFEIHFLKNVNKTEYTSIAFDLSANKVWLDRRKSSLSDGTRDLREAAYVFDHNDTIKVNVFLDHSTIEVFLDQLVVFSARVYPDLPSSNLVDLVVKAGQVTINRLDCWTLKSFEDAMEPFVCEPINLPDSMRVDTSSGLGYNIIKNNETINVFPNPATSLITIEGKNFKGSKIILYDITGRIVLEKDETINEITHTLDISHLKRGVYFLAMKNKQMAQSRKVILY